MDNNELLKDIPNTIMADLTNIDFAFNAHWFQPELVWASPPCREFSNAYGAPAPTAQRNGEHFEPDMRPLEAAIRLIKHFKPRYWVIENVSGASKIFSKHLGVNAPRQIVGPFYLWGNFPFLHVPRYWEHSKSGEDVWSSDPLRANKKGKIPLEVSQMLLDSVIEQTQLTEWV